MCSTAFHQLGFSDDDTRWVFESCAGILHLGNITFTSKGEGSQVSSVSQDALVTAANFLKVCVTKCFISFTYTFRNIYTFLIFLDYRFKLGPFLWVG